MTRTRRVAVACVMQETNTFAPRSCGMEDFTVARGEDAAARVRGTNSEMAGALTAVAAAGAEAVPILHAWAMPNGPVEHETFVRLRDELLTGLDVHRGWDAVVLALHGAMATTEIPDADGALLAAVRRLVGPEVPIVVSLDLHANVTRRMVGAASAIVGYHTDPHVDMAATGRRAGSLAVATVTGEVRPSTALAKRPMIVPAEAMNTTSGPLGEVRRLIEAEARMEVLDVSLFPVQPWLDVPELSFGVLVTTEGAPRLADELAERYADEVWRRRHRFTVDRLLDPRAAVAAARESQARPFIIAESADAPTAGAAGDSPVMVRVLAEDGGDLVAYVPVVDPAGVEVCHEAGVGASVELEVGAGIDRRWSEPVPVGGRVVRTGAGSYRLTGAGYTGMEVSMGRFAVLASGGLHVLLSERPAWTADPATFLHAGLDPAGADILVVRSCSDFRPNYPGSAVEAVTLDVPGPATPRLQALRFERAPRPLWPLDPVDDEDPRSVRTARRPTVEREG